MKRTSSGFTLVELLVVISIIGVLMALLIPAVNAAREVARRNTCATNQKNLALAATLHNNGKKTLPGYVQRFGLFVAGSDPSDPGNTAVPRHVKVGTWAVALLPNLDAQPTYEHWTEDRYPIQAGMGAELGMTNDGFSGTGYHTLAAPNLAIFQCPSNPIDDAEYGKNSYISNNGFCPIASTGMPVTFMGTSVGAAVTASQTKNNGAFVCKYNASGMPLVRTGEGGTVQLDDFKDGQGNTILFSENVQALPWHRAGFIDATDLTITGSGTPLPTEVAFAVETARYVNGMVWHYEDPKFDAMPAPPWNKNGDTTADVPQAVTSFHLINGGGGSGGSVGDERFTLQMTATNARDLARPSSAHVDGVNAGMADGATRFIADTIDYRVYQALLTPRGKSSNVPLARVCVDRRSFLVLDSRLSYQSRGLSRGASAFFVLIL